METPEYSHLFAATDLSPIASIAFQDLRIAFTSPHFPDAVGKAKYSSPPAVRGNEWLEVNWSDGRSQRVRNSIAARVDAMPLLLHVLKTIGLQSRMALPQIATSICSVRSSSLFHTIIEQVLSIALLHTTAHTNQSITRGIHLFHFAIAFALGATLLFGDRLWARFLKEILTLPFFGSAPCFKM